MGESYGDRDGRQYANLREALYDRRIPTENHAFVERLTENIGIVAYFERGTYIKAVRAGDGPDLNIASGWTNGFVSAEEAVAAAGGALKPWPSDRGTGQWFVDHPIHGPRDGGGDRNAPTSFGHCPVCTFEFSAAGTCGC